MLKAWIYNQFLVTTGLFHTCLLTSQNQNRQLHRFLFKNQYISVFQNFGWGKCFPITVFVNTSIPSERIRVCKSVEQIEGLYPESTDVFKRNMVDRYIGRSNNQYKNGMYDIVDQIHFAIFVAHFYFDYENKHKNDVLGEETKVTPKGIFEASLKSLPLMSSSHKLKLRERRKVLRHHVPNKRLHPEKLSHYLEFLF